MFVAAEGSIAGTPVVRRLCEASNATVEDWPAGPGWAAAFSVSLITDDFASLVSELAAELGGSAAGGWSDNGVIFFGCLSNGTPEAPLLIGFNLSGEDLYEEQGDHPALLFLEGRWGSPWADAATPAVTQWLRQFRRGVQPDDVREILDEPYGDAAEGLVDVLRLAGFRWNPT
ncbi:hypothetical protein ABN034_30110 [Actinopolymorpha sp. B11F2]|uniref:hypothetical protein n=1 Tax=Actinopolymorpha sp. B11F2 TaxID=3160862 RepID=UPI0032E4AC2C